ncbi:MAG TPA: M20/M25/M40 family metallo-hydrolase [Chloroflexota bacterium]|jgi:acetylornithine deacetylase/succinyl-diaminopimelate desuccinylase-like protein
MVAEPASASARQRLLATIDDDQQDLIDLCLHLGNTPTPHGQERVLAQWVADWLTSHGIRSWLQPITADSANVVGRIPGTADGVSLIYNAHLDTGPALPPDASESNRRIHQAWAEDGVLYGYGLVNDKAQLAAFMIAARALRKAHLQLRGDLTLSGVAFETGWPSVDDRQGINYPGEGLGTWWLFNRGVTADYALVGETSGFGLITAECGVLGVEVRTHGREVYTPRLERGASLHDHPSAVVRLAHLVPVLDEWAVRYEATHRQESPAGTIVPKAQVQTVEGQAEWARTHMDVRLAPGANPRAVQREIEEYLRERGFACELEPYQWSRGYVARNAEPLIAAVTEAHQALFGSPPPPPPTAEISMWRDVNMFNEVGVPSICYGPPRQREPYSDPGNRAVKIADLLDATKVYALAAVNLCGLADE